MEERRHLFSELPQHGKRSNKRLQREQRIHRHTGQTANETERQADQDSSPSSCRLTDPPTTSLFSLLTQPTARHSRRPADQSRGEGLADQSRGEGLTDQSRGEGLADQSRGEGLTAQRGLCREDCYPEEDVDMRRVRQVLTVSTPQHLRQSPCAAAVPAATIPLKSTFSKYLSQVSAKEPFRPFTAARKMTSSYQFAHKVKREPTIQEEDEEESADLALNQTVALRPSKKAGGSKVTRPSLDVSVQVLDREKEVPVPSKPAAVLKQFTLQDKQPQCDLLLPTSLEKIPLPKISRDHHRSLLRRASTKKMPPPKLRQDQIQCDVFSEMVSTKSLQSKMIKDRPSYFQSDVALKNHLPPLTNSQPGTQLPKIKEADEEPETSLDKPSFPQRRRMYKAAKQTGKKSYHEEKPFQPLTPATFPSKNQTLYINHDAVKNRNTNSKNSVAESPSQNGRSKSSKTVRSKTIENKHRIVNTGRQGNLNNHAIDDENPEEDRLTNINSRPSNSGKISQDGLRSLNTAASEGTHTNEVSGGTTKLKIKTSQSFSGQGSVSVSEIGHPLEKNSFKATSLQNASFSNKSTDDKEKEPQPSTGPQSLEHPDNGKGKGRSSPRRKSKARKISKFLGSRPQGQRKASSRQQGQKQASKEEQRQEGSRPQGQKRASKEEQRQEGSRPQGQKRASKEEQRQEGSRPQGQKRASKEEQRLESRAAAQQKMQEQKKVTLSQYVDIHGELSSTVLGGDTDTHTSDADDRPGEGQVRKKSPRQSPQRSTFSSVDRRSRKASYKAKKATRPRKAGPSGKKAGEPEYEESLTLKPCPTPELSIPEIQISQDFDTPMELPEIEVSHDSLVLKWPSAPTPAPSIDQMESSDELSEPQESTVSLGLPVLEVSSNEDDTARLDDTADELTISQVELNEDEASTSTETPVDMVAETATRNRKSMSKRWKFVQVGIMSSIRLSRKKKQRSAVKLPEILMAGGGLSGGGGGGGGGVRHERSKHTPGLLSKPREQVGSRNSMPTFSNSHAPYESYSDTNPRQSWGNLQGEIGAVSKTDMSHVIFSRRVGYSPSGTLPSKELESKVRAWKRNMIYTPRAAMTDRMVRESKQRPMRESLAEKDIHSYQIYTLAQQLVRKQEHSQSLVRWYKVTRAVFYTCFIARAMAKRSCEIFMEFPTFMDIGDAARVHSKSADKHIIGDTHYKASSHEGFCMNPEEVAILSADPERRTEGQINLVLHKLQLIDSFCDFPLQTQRAIAKLAYYFRIRDKRVIVREGHVPHNFYFILSGQAVISRIEEGQKGPFRQTQTTLTKGDMFGDAAIINRCERVATVSARTEMQLLYISLNDYIDIFMPERNNDGIPDYIKFLSQQSWMKNWPVDILDDNVKKCYLRYFRQRHVIVADSTLSEDIYIIRSGQCHVLMCVESVTARWRDVDQLITEHFLTYDRFLGLYHEDRLRKLQARKTRSLVRALSARDVRKESTRVHPVPPHLQHLVVALNAARRGGRHFSSHAMQAHSVSRQGQLALPALEQHAGDSSQSEHGHSRSTSTAHPGLTQADPRHSTKTSFQRSPKPSVQHSPKTSVKHSTKISVQHSTKTSVQHSTKTSVQHSTKTSVQHSPKTSVQRSPKTSLQHSTKTSLQHSTKTSLQHSPKTSPQHSTKTSLQHSTKTSLQHSPKTSPQHSSKTSLKENTGTIYQHNSGTKKTSSQLNDSPQSSTRMSRSDSHVVKMRSPNTSVQGSNSGRGSNETESSSGQDSFISSSSYSSASAVQALGTPEQQAQIQQAQAQVQVQGRPAQQTQGSPTQPGPAQAGSRQGNLSSSTLHRRRQYQIPKRCRPASRAASAPSRPRNPPPVFVEILVLKEGDVFGFDQLEMPTCKPLKSHQVSLVSGGAEVIVLKKRFFVQHANVDVQQAVQMAATSFPGPEVIRHYWRMEQARTLYQLHIKNQSCQARVYLH